MLVYSGGRNYGVRPGALRPLGTEALKTSCALS
jgi:hypothetical protein